MVEYCILYYIMLLNNRVTYLHLKELTVNAKYVTQQIFFSGCLLIIYKNIKFDHSSTQVNK